ncbi:MAG: TonB-dependent receptor [Zoogloea sp.]|nr:TonB-dependent receptor [Zoogloea sp.]
MPLLPDKRFLCSLLTGPALALAADAVSVTGAEAPFFEDLPTVLSASRLPQPLNEAPGAITILDREFIQATGYRDVARLLRLVPGMQIGQERGHSQWVTYHGLGGDFPSEIQVLIDGRSVYAPNSAGGVDWSALPLTVPEIERIEIVRGTNSNAYGANAFLGVINIITSHSHQEHSASGQLNIGTQGIADAQVSWTGGGNGAGVRLTAARTQDTGFSGLNDSRLSQTLSLRSDYRIDARDELTLRAGYNHIHRGAGYPDSLFNNNGERTAASENSALHLTWRRTLSQDEEWLVSLYRNHESSIEHWLASAPGFAGVPVNRSRRSDRSNAEIQHRFALNDQARLVWGLEGRHDETSSPFLFARGKPPTFNLYRVFSNLDWHLAPNWQLNLGGLLEKSGDKAAQFVPRAFINWQSTPSSTLRAGYARAWQQRNQFDIYGDVRVYAPGSDPATSKPIAWPYVPNPDLRTPSVDTLELGYLGRFPSIDATVDVRLFHERISHFVIRRSIPSPGGPLALPALASSQFDNLSAPVVLRGVEYQFRTRPRPGTEVLLSHTVIDRHTNEPDVAARTAPYSASLTWLQDYGGGWKSAASILRMGSLSGGYGYVPGCAYMSADYTSFDLRLARAFRLDGRKVEMALNGINLGGRHQELADRSQQCLPQHVDKPVNPASPMVWMSLAVEL